MRNRSKNKIKFLIIRHGSTKGNEEKRYIGRTDESLSENGMNKIGEKKSVYKKTDLLFASPMKRCRQTAGILFPYNEAIIIDELREMDFGCFEGKNFSELSDDARYKEWVDSGCKGMIPDGEGFDDFINRSVTGFEKCLDICKMHADIELATAVVHGGTIMAVLSSLTGKDFFDFHTKNGEGYCLELEDNKLTSFNKISFD